MSKEDKILPRVSKPKRSQKSRYPIPSQPFDYGLGFALVALGMLGVIMVASASIVIADKTYHAPFYFAHRHIIYLLIGMVVGYACYRLPLEKWEQFAPVAMILSFALLILVLLPGIGRTVNGSTRWLSLGPVSFQVSEWVKFSVVLYISSYVVRQHKAVTQTIAGFLKPMGLLSLFSLLLLKQPDFGATFVMMSMALALLFLGGVPLRQFIGLLAVILIAFAALAISAPYRLERLTSFLDPWADQFDSGYQLTQALIAFGRGEWWGVGIGSSVQKLFYLPEAHTDFVYAVLAEELGLVGALAVLLLYALLVYRGLHIARRAKSRQAHFEAYVAYGMSLWIGLQAFINIGVNTGVLPTKGLTLPLMSYGGSSLVIICMGLGVLMGVDRENRRHKGTL